MTESRASLLGLFDWVLVFLTVPVALAMVSFRFTWAPTFVEVFRDSGAALPKLTQWVLDGILLPVWGIVGLGLVVAACATARVPLGLRRGALIGAAAWLCLGAGLTWFALFLPFFGATGY